MSTREPPAQPSALVDEFADEFDNVPDDDLDDILNGRVNGVDVFDITDRRPQRPETTIQPRATAKVDLGIDEEVTLVRKRKPIPKLDDNKLLSEAGIPRLRRISKDRLRFKGKGHEYGDIARMLNMYQLWLDDLYPRMKFADGLSIVERLGHSKRVQIMRKAWIDEGKPRSTSVFNPEDDDTVMRDQPASNVEDAHPVALRRSSLHAPDGDLERQGTERGSPADAAGPSMAVTEVTQPDEDELDALFADEESSSKQAEANQPDEDELDALLAEDAAPDSAPQAPVSNTEASRTATRTEGGESMDDLIALAEMEE